MNPKVAVVVLNYNTQALLEKYLGDIMASDYNNMDVWVVDNASKDDSVCRVDFVDYIGADETSTIWREV